MDCSINEECVSYLRLLWEEEKIVEESNKEQVILLFLAPSYCYAHFNCCFEDLLLNFPIPQPEMWSISCQFLVMLNSPFVFPPGARG